MEMLRIHHPIILASKSPRRKSLLKKAGVTFSITPSSVDERSFTPSSPDDFASTLAAAKADEISGNHPGSWVIGADTIVVSGKDILG